MNWFLVLEKNNTSYFADQKVDLLNHPEYLKYKATFSPLSAKPSRKQSECGRLRLRRTYLQLMMSLLVTRIPPRLRDCPRGFLNFVLPSMCCCIRIKFVARDQIMRPWIYHLPLSLLHWILWVLAETRHGQMECFLMLNKLLFISLTHHLLQLIESFTWLWFLAGTLLNP